MFKMARFRPNFGCSKSTFVIRCCSAVSVILLLQTCAVVVVLGYPMGAPTGACKTLKPVHQSAEPQGSSPPFSIEISSKAVSPGERIKIKLNTTDGTPFKGYMLQVREVNNADSVIGTFLKGEKSINDLTCGSGTKNTITHSSRNPKTLVETDWEAPADFSGGDLIVQGTFLRDFSTFWTNVTSDVFTVNRLSSPTDQSNADSELSPKLARETTTSRTTLSTHFDFGRPAESEQLQEHEVYTGCFDTKGCFGQPAGCESSSNCQMMVTYKKTADTYEFELYGTSQNYVASGLSDDDKMNTASVVECQISASQTNPELHMSWNIEQGYGNQRQPSSDGVQLIKSSIENGYLYCHFTRNPITTVQGREYNLARNHFLLLAKGDGPNDDNNGVGVGYHFANRVASASAVDLSSVGAVGAASKLLLRLHGSFMIAAWIGTASCGIMLARYFKQTWVGKQMFGKDLWFVWHRAFMVTTWCLTLIGFGLIFGYVKGWIQSTQISAQAHAVLGCIVTGLAFFQPIAAYFRPHPGTPKRAIFNWLHWMGGNTAHILGIVTIFLAETLVPAELPHWIDWILVAYVLVYVVTHLTMSFQTCWAERRASSQVNTFQLKDLGPGRVIHTSSGEKKDAPGSSFRKAVLGLYLFFIIGVTIALIAIVALAPIESTVTNMK